MNKKLLGFDECSKEHKAKGGDKRDLKPCSDKVVSENILEVVKSQKETHSIRKKKLSKDLGK